MLTSGIILTDNAQIVNAHMESGATYPVSPIEGRLFYIDSTSGGFTKGLYIFDGTTWTPCSGNSNSPSEPLTALDGGGY